MNALYNEIDPYAARWLRNLSHAGHIARGAVDERSIEALKSGDLQGVTQFHAFAGIGVWSHALRLAGWPDDFPIWTGSCPCQPFSQAGDGAGFADERHLWLEWFRLIRECRPPIVVGEQVASPDGLAWLDAVCADMEGAGYAFGAADLCAAGVGAPHIRQRLYFAGVSTEWLAHHHQQRRSQLGFVAAKDGHAQPGTDADGRGEAGGLVHADGFESRRNAGDAARAEGEDASEGSLDRRVGVEPVDSGATRGFWRDVEWLPCRDGKHRPAQPGLFPLAHGAPARVGRLRAYGNAIVGPVAATFLRCLRDFLT